MSSISDTTTPALAGLARRKRNRRRWLIVGTAVVVLLIGSGIAFARLRTPVTTVAAADTTVLAPATLQNSVSATGTVASASTTKVYSTLAYAVTDIYVSVGSVVAKGDKLLDLDKATLNKQLSVKQATLDQSGAASGAAVKSAQDNYNAAAAALTDGTNSAILAAQAQVTSAYNGWVKAQESYDAYFAGVDENDPTDMTLLPLRQLLDAAQSACDAAALADPGPETTCDSYSKTPPDDVTSLQSAQTALFQAQAKYDAAFTAAENNIASLKLTVSAAYDAYTAAQASLDATKVGAQTQLQSLKNAVNSAKVQGAQTASMTDLANLRQDLASTTIVAPAAGTVTAVYSKVGANGAGLVLVIEDVEHLVINSTVKEYDVNTLTVGMSVTIASDATRDDVYEGKLTSIDPTSTKDQAGETVTTGDVLYGTEIEVTSTDTRLRIGMSVRINYVIDSQDGVLAVPVDAVLTNTAGAKVVLVAVKQQDGRYLLQELPVTTGLENDLSVVVTGPGVAEGLRLINAPSKLKAGEVVVLNGIS